MVGCSICGARGKNSRTHGKPGHIDPRVPAPFPDDAAAAVATSTAESVGIGSETREKEPEDGRRRRRQQRHGGGGGGGAGTAGDSEKVHVMSVGALNADWTNRHKALNSGDKLNRGLYELMSGRMNVPSLTAISEMPSKGMALSYRDYVQPVFEGVEDRLGYDAMSLLFRADDYVLDSHAFKGKAYTYSHPGKYLSFIAEHRTTAERVLVIGAHLRSKGSGNQSGQQLRRVSACIINNFIEEAEQIHDINHVVISGDMNDEPAFIDRVFPTLTPVMRPADGPTTAAGRHLDNVLLSDAAHILQKTIHSDYGLLSHHPIVVDLLWDR